MALAAISCTCGIPKLSQVRPAILRAAASPTPSQRHRQRLKNRIITNNYSDNTGIREYDNARSPRSQYSITAKHRTITYLPPAKLHQISNLKSKIPSSSPALQLSISPALHPLSPFIVWNLSARQLIIPAFPGSPTPTCTTIASNTVSSYYHEVLLLSTLHYHNRSTFSLSSLPFSLFSFFSLSQDSPSGRKRLAPLCSLILSVPLWSTSSILYHSVWNKYDSNLLLLKKKHYTT